MDCSERTPSISAVGEALVALEIELEELAQQDEMLVLRRRLIHKKMEICHKTIKDILIGAGGKYKAKDWPKFEELNHPG